MRVNWRKGVLVSVTGALHSLLPRQCHSATVPHTQHSLKNPQQHEPPTTTPLTVYMFRTRHGFTVASGRRRWRRWREVKNACRHVHLSIYSTVLLLQRRRSIVVNCLNVIALSSYLLFWLRPSSSWRCAMNSGTSNTNKP